VPVIYPGSSRSFQPRIVKSTHHKNLWRKPVHLARRCGKMSLNNRKHFLAILSLLQPNTNGKLLPPLRTQAASLHFPSEVPWN
jgi:hypothetical protein